MEAFKPLGQFFRQIGGINPKTASGHTGIIYVCFNHAASWIHPKATAHLSVGMLFIMLCHLRIKLIKLSKRVKSYMTAALKKLRECTFSIDRTIGMDFVAKTIK